MAGELNVGPSLKRKASAFANLKLDLMKASKPKVPRADDVKLVPTESTTLEDIAPPTFIKWRLGTPSSLVIGFDVETHDWLNGERKGRIGNFGWYTMDPPALTQYSRIVELGWVLVAVDTSSVLWRKSYRVTPEGFSIASRTTDVHKITQEDAQQSGKPLKAVLEEFMADVKNVADKGVRLVAHHLEFDANIILEELGRCMPSMQDAWRDIARRNGYCTMNPEVGRWLMESCGAEVKGKEAKPVKGLQWMLHRLLPKRRDLIDQHHAGASDAEAAALIFIALSERVTRLSS